MLTGLRAILDSEIATPAGSYAVADAWLDGGTARLVYLEVETGGLLSRGRALIHASRIAPGDPLTSDVTAEQIEAAETEPEGGFLLDPLGLPAILTGPFGNTISPLLIAAGLRAEAAEEAPPRPGAAEDEDEAPTPTQSLDRADDWLGAPVFGRDGELGTVSDVTLAKADFALAHLLVATVSGRRSVPWAAVRRLASSGHVVVAGDARTLEGSPDIAVARDFSTEDADAILRHWGVAPPAPQAV